MAAAIMIFELSCYCPTSRISSSNFRCSKASFFSARLRCSFSTFSYFFQYRSISGEAKARGKVSTVFLGLQGGSRTSFMHCGRAADDNVVWQWRRTQQGGQFSLTLKPTASLNLPSASSAYGRILFSSNWLTSLNRSVWASPRLCEKSTDSLEDEKYIVTYNVLEVSWSIVKHITISSCWELPDSTVDRTPSSHCHGPWGN